MLLRKSESSVETMVAKNILNIGVSFSLIVFFVIVEATIAFGSEAVFFAGQTQSKKRATSRKNRKRIVLTAKSNQAKRRKRAFIEVASIPTPIETVEEMLKQADLKKGDVLYDLGSGDGRIPIEAAKKYGARAIGVEIKLKLVEEANKRAVDEGVGKLARFVHADMFRLSLRRATVVTLYLSEDLNLRLLPNLFRDLKPGAKIISHDFRMGSWLPEKAIRVPAEKNLFRTVFVWTVPPKPEQRQLIEQSRKDRARLKELYGALSD